MLSTITGSRNYKWWAFGAIGVGSFASVMDHGSVNIALPTIAAHFETDLPSVQWVVLGFALTISALLLPMGRLGDLIGLKKLYIIGSLVFIVGAAFAGFSPSLPALILARLLQGCGAAMTQGSGMAIIVATFPPGERGKAIGFVMTIVGTGAIAGPAIGGVLVDTLGWPSVFFVNIPLVILGAALCGAILDGRRTTRQAPGTRPGRFDWLGAALSTGALLILLVGMTNAHRAGWTSAPILAAMFGFLAFLGTFIWWELRCSSPMFDLSFFRHRTFSLGVAAGFFTFLGSSAVLFLTPFYLQSVLGYSAKEAGLVVVPGAICMALVGPLSGRLSDRYGWRPLTVGGLALSAIGVFMLSRVTEGSSLLLVLSALIFTSSGMGIFYSPNTSSVLSTVGREQYGVVSAFLNLVRNSGNIISIALATAIVVATMAAMGYAPSLDAVQGAGPGGVSQAFTSGLRLAYLSMMALILVALAVSAVKPSLPHRPAEPITEAAPGTTSGR